MHNEITLNRKLIQTRGTITKLRINFKIALMFPEGERKEFIADFKKSWFIVSQILVRAIRNKIKTKPSLTPKPSLSRKCLMKQI